MRRSAPHLQSFESEGQCRTALKSKVHCASQHCRTSDDRSGSFASFLRCPHQVCFPLIATVKAEIVL